mmetsp:Transcript_12962/g.30745  ORF Transcript_12962/g.30745 Transcript_12962/m.30745 type:complete len:211 (+) Transcript_12962:1012-1644(+)
MGLTLRGHRRRQSLRDHYKMSQRERWRERGSTWNSQGGDGVPLHEPPLWGSPPPVPFLASGAHGLVGRVGLLQRVEYHVRPHERGHVPALLLHLVRVDKQVGAAPSLLDAFVGEEVPHADGLPAAALPQHSVHGRQEGDDVAAGVLAPRVERRLDLGLELRLLLALGLLPAVRLLPRLQLAVDSVLDAPGAALTERGPVRAVRAGACGPA